MLLNHLKCIISKNKLRFSLYTDLKLLKTRIVSNQQYEDAWNDFPLGETRLAETYCSF